MGKTRGRRGKSARKEDERLEKRDQQVAIQEAEQQQQAHDSFGANDSSYVYTRLPEADPELIRYLITAESLLRADDFPDADARELFMSSVFAEIRDRTWDVAADYDGSRILEWLYLSVHTPGKREWRSRIHEAMAAVQGRVVDYAMGQFSSHFLQMLLALAADCIDSMVRGHNVDDAGECAEFVGVFLATCDEVRTAWMTLITERYGSHILRGVMVILANEASVSNATPSPAGASGTSAFSAMRSKKSRLLNKASEKATAEDILGRKRKVPSEFRDALADIVGAVTNGLGETEVRAFALHPVASPVLQLCLVLGNAAGLQQDTANLVNKLLMGYIQNAGTADEPDHARDSFMQLLFKDQIGSHLLEKLLPLFDEPTFHRFFADYIQNRLAALCDHPIANFVVQKVIAAAKSPEQLTLILDEIKPSLETLLKSRPGVIKGLVDACITVNDSHHAVVNAICDALGLETHTDRLQLVPCLLTGRKLDDDQTKASSNSLYIKVPGALILQSMFAFPSANLIDVVISSLMHIPTVHLIRWSKHPVASRVVEAFFTAPAVSVKAKRKLVYNMFDRVHELPEDKYGSHLVDKIWQVADIQTKEKLAEAFLAHQDTIAHNFHGQFVWRNCRLDEFKRRRSDWILHQKSAVHKHAIVKDVINFAGDDSAQPKPLTNGGKRAMPDADEIDVLFQSRPDELQHTSDSKVKSTRKAVRTAKESKHQKDLTTLFESIDMGSKKRRTK